MNRQQLVRRLGDVAGRNGLDVGALARRLDTTEVEVTSAMSGASDFSVDMLVGLADALGLSVALEDAPPATRHAGPVPTVVDLAVAKVEPDSVVFPTSKPTGEQS
jgi:hypothetical protein